MHDENAVYADVLIVPCGMETRFEEYGNLSAFSINCTLRNGNRTSEGVVSYDVEY